MKKINKQKLARIIKEQVLKSKRKQILRESVSRAVRKVLLNEKKVDPEEFPLKLSDVAADASDAKQNVTKGRQDGNETDDVIDVKPNATCRLVVTWVRLLVVIIILWMVTIDGLQRVWLIPLRKLVATQWISQALT